MNADAATLLSWAPAFMLVLARVGGAMALLPAVGEIAAPARVRIGMALSVTILLLPGIQPMVPSLPDAGIDVGLMVAGEVVTGLWFGWLARIVALAPAMAGQIIAYLVGLSTVLQPDQELGSQTTALAKVLEMATPAILLVSGLYRLPFLALRGLFDLIPPGHMLAVPGAAERVVGSLTATFSLALQLASPFIVMGVIWFLVIGLLSRLVSRMQLYFVSAPGQMIVGGILLLFTLTAILGTWKTSAAEYLSLLPGRG